MYKRQEEGRGTVHAALKAGKAFDEGRYLDAVGGTLSTPFHFLNDMFNPNSVVWKTIGRSYDKGGVSGVFGDAGKRLEKAFTGRSYRVRDLHGNYFTEVDRATYDRARARGPGGRLEPGDEIISMKKTEAELALVNDNLNKLIGIYGRAIPVPE